MKKTKQINVLKDTHDSIAKLVASKKRLLRGSFSIQEEASAAIRKHVEEETKLVELIQKAS